MLQEDDGRRKEATTIDFNIDVRCSCGKLVSIYGHNARAILGECLHCGQIVVGSLDLYLVDKSELS